MDVVRSDRHKITRIKVIQQLRNLVIGDSGYRGKKLDMAGRAAIPTVSYHQISQLLYYFNSGSFWSIASHHIHITFFCPWAFFYNNTGSFSVRYRDGQIWDFRGLRRPAAGLWPAAGLRPAGAKKSSRWNLGCFHMSRWLFPPNFSSIGLHNLEL